MDENRIQDAEDVVAVEFKTAFKGYNMAEVDEYITAQTAELEDIRAENAELYKKIEKLSRKLQKFIAAEEERKRLFESTNAEADKIIRDAKKMAAKELLRTRRKCTRMVTEMTGQVDEQRRLCEATKIEAAKFRRELFTLYRNHIELINAMSEASGAFDEDSATRITDEDVANLEKLLEENYEEAKREEETYEEIDQSVFDSELGQAMLIEAFSDTASITIPPSSKAKGAKGKKEKGEKKKQRRKDAEAEERKTLAAMAFEDSDSEEEEEEDVLFGESSMYAEASFDDKPEEKEEGKESDDGDDFDEIIEDDAEEYEDDAEYEEDEYEEDAEDNYSEEKLVGEALYEGDPAFTITEEDLDEFTNPDGAEMEYDSTVSVDSVFKKNAIDKDFNKLYGDYPVEEVKEAKAPKMKAEARPTVSDEKRKNKKNSYGFNVTSVKKADPDDDSNEFYMESDAEFDPSATDGIPTGTVSSFGVNSRAPSTERRWRVKKSKSLTDEFDVIKAAADEDL